MTTVYLALGSNVGDSPQFIAEAINLLGGALQNIRRAPLYTSKAVGYTDQPDFLNTVLRAETNFTPTELLDFVKGVEQRVGRVERFRWGPREIDIDIIFYGDTVMETEKLTVPHPRFAEREFVLIPLDDLNPDLVDPLSQQTVAQLLDRLPPSQKSVLKQVEQ